MLDSDFSRRLVMAVDAEGYGSGDDLRHDSIQFGLAQVMDRGAREAGLRRETWSRQEAGDGEVIVLPEGEPELRVIDDLVRRLRKALHDHNRERRDDARLRIRISIGHGVVKRGAMGFVGQVVVTTCRLLDANAARTALKTNPRADLVLILTDRLYEDVIRQLHTSHRPESFTQVKVPTKERTEIAWMWIPSEDLDQKGTLDMDNLPAVADTLWALIASGALERLGAYGTETGLGGARRLLAKIKEFRSEQGRPADPESRDDLLESLEKLVRVDPAAEQFAQKFNAEQMTVNLITAPISGEEINFGIRN
ncbi:hypothetical protein Sme01_33770 [Sphaerisporangium melleum]|uniref:Guanylate cyclase domain-containing protein n=1 Tax=Sphaerisporangium melleum TaxID=321316 RepID=A0A917VGB5_9ACTN|nr:hypothetical protein [Sphaerisporangium melleum]GGK74304.1 hypothetical protein GCM10007964_16440 [Sphaerisporangium melleum]GII70901.1 hypothetical protein Sme01_33770 [Sphaerisporangium melleum]